MPLHEGAKSRYFAFSVCASWHWQVPVEDAEGAEHVGYALGEVRREAEEGCEGNDAEQVERGEAGDGRQHIEEIIESASSWRKEAESESKLDQDASKMTKWPL